MLILYIQIFWFRTLVEYLSYCILNKILFVRIFKKYFISSLRKKLCTRQFINFFLLFFYMFQRSRFRNFLIRKSIWSQFISLILNLFYWWIINLKSIQWFWNHRIIKHIIILILFQWFRRYFPMTFLLFHEKYSRSYVITIKVHIIFLMFSLF